LCFTDASRTFHKVFPALFDWVSYPIAVLIKELYNIEMKDILLKRQPCPFQLELLASLERLLCFCHTGSTAVFATTLMNQLGLSRGALTDGFPMLHEIFIKPTIVSAMRNNLRVDARLWPLHNGYPAIASKKSQIYWYSLSHFMVRVVSCLSIHISPLGHQRDCTLYETLCDVRLLRGCIVVYERTDYAMDRPIDRSLRT
jgi:hypothetical protein